MAKRNEFLISPEQQQQILAWSQDGIGPAEQARRLELPRTRIMHTYKELAKAGLIPRRPSTRGRDWADAEERHLLEMVDTGMSIMHIATQLNRTPEAIKIKLVRIGASHQKRGTTMTAREIAALLGLGCAKIVASWITRGWLQAAKRADTNRTWHIRWEDLETFLQCPDCWMAWEPDRITSPSLRIWATQLREGQPRWLTPGEVAERYYVHPNVVSSWINKGWLPATRYGNWWINERTLEGYDPSSAEAEAARKQERLAAVQAPLLEEQTRLAEEIAVQEAHLLHLRDQLVVVEWKLHGTRALHRNAATRAIHLLPEHLQPLVAPQVVPAAPASPSAPLVAERQQIQQRLGIYTSSACVDSPMLLERRQRLLERCAELISY